MRFLLDTNILIPAEPTSADDVEPGTRVVAELLQLLGRGGHQFVLHPATVREIRGDKDATRRELRLLLSKKYPLLEAPPPLDPALTSVLGSPASGSHDEVDLTILSAVAADCVDYLVTDDTKLRQRAQRVGLAERVVTAADASTILRGLFPLIPAPPPLVDPDPAYSLNEKDPIFESLRSDYPPFDDWFKKCKREHRQTWVVKTGNRYAGICIVNPERLPQYGLSGKTLKLCTFKVSDDFRGHRYGELLLKTVFAYLQENAYEGAFIEVYPKHEELIELLKDFGFEEVGTKATEEVILAKGLVPPQETHLDPLAFNVRYGPHQVSVGDAAGAFIVPIQPQYHRLLFPEAEVVQQLPLFQSSHPFGNSLRKAYLCGSRITTLKPGSLLLFYRSQDLQAVTAVGVAEGLLRSTSADEIARFVGRRTVYAYEDIQKMAAHPVLAVLFRQARLLRAPWPLSLVKRSGLVQGAPQSIAKIPKEAEVWLTQQLQQ